ncbi:hypothetical protein DERF_015028 [Dermatophagoides farinae]|uniref:Uncharacterized protein n=1 Tax=Dermatophagoides farinae TaxID=6954 RepID=A0A922L1U1_DERFA|nr:hypothetical protein DERF_015028 [Dermatophagoides farinae]
MPKKINNGNVLKLKYTMYNSSGSGSHFISFSDDSKLPYAIIKEFFFIYLKIQQVNQDGPISVHNHDKKKWPE